MNFRVLKKGFWSWPMRWPSTRPTASNAPRAEKTRKELELAMHLMQPTTATWTPPVLTCSAVERRGLSTIWQTVLDHREKLERTGELAAKRRDQALQWMWSLIQEGLRDRFHRHAGVRAQLQSVVNDVRRGEMVPTTAAQRLLFLLDNQNPDCRQ
jgi:LAO/AO transport system kinase